MDAAEWWIIKIAFGALSSIFGLPAAIFAFWGVAQNDKHEPTRRWFKQKWVAIKESRWLSLSEAIIRSVLQLKTAIIEKVNASLIHWGWDWEVLWGILVLSCWALLVIGSFLTWGIYGGILAVLFFSLSPLIGLFKESMDLKRYRNIKVGWFGNISDLALFFYLFSLFGMTVALWTLQVLNMRIVYASITMAALLPLYGCYIVLPVEVFAELFTDWNVDKLFPFSIAVTVSFTVTLLAMLVGHFANPSAWVPQTLQMLVSNVIFDGLTMIVTLALLSWAIAKRSMLRIPCAIFLDIVIAALLACCSLYFGLVFTEKAVTWGETFNVLLGKSSGAKGFELGPYFWTMHTTFLPTLLYLSLIFVAWTGKFMLLPIKWFLGTGQEHNSPLKLTAALLTLFSVAFGSLSFMASTAEEICKKKQKDAIKNISEKRVDYEEGKTTNGAVPFSMD